MSEYYSATGAPATSATLSSSAMRAEFALQEAGTDKLPTLSGNGDEVVVINSAGTAMSTVAEAAFKALMNIEAGVDFQAYDAGLADIAGLAVTDGNIIVADGANWVAESGATARASLGLGSISTQSANSVSITGGTLAGIAQCDVDNLRLNGNTFSSTNTNGNINLIPDGTGKVVIQHTGNTVMQSDTGGIDIFSDGSAGSNATLQIVDGDSESALLRKRGDNGSIEVRNQEHGGNVHLQSEDTGGTNRDLVVGDPDGASTLYYAGSAKVATTTGGADITGVLGLTSYTVAGLPSAAQAGTVAYCSDETGGAVLIFADGSDWRRCTDRAVVS